MKTFFKLVLLMFIALFVLGIVGGTALWHEIAREAGSGLSVSINGEDLDVQGLAGLHGGLGAVIGLGVAAVVMFIVVPVVLVFSIGLPLLIVGCVLAAVLAGVFSIGAVLTSPFVLFVLLMAWLLRRKPQRAAPRNRPNIAT